MWSPELKLEIDRCIVRNGVRFYIFAHPRTMCRTTTKLAVQQEWMDTRIAANDGSEQVSTVKRRSASGDGVDSLNTHAMAANLSVTRYASRNYVRNALNEDFPEDVWQMWKSLKNWSAFLLEFLSDVSRGFVIYCNNRYIFETGITEKEIRENHKPAIFRITLPRNSCFNEQLNIHWISSHSLVSHFLTSRTVKILSLLARVS